MIRSAHVLLTGIGHAHSAALAPLVFIKMKIKGTKKSRLVGIFYLQNLHWNRVTIATTRLITIGRTHDY